MPPGIGYGAKALNLARGQYGSMAAGAAIGGALGVMSGMRRDDTSVIGGGLGGALRGAMVGAMVPGVKGALAGYRGARAGGVSPWGPAMSTAMHRMKLDARFSFSNARIGANMGFSKIKAGWAAASGRWAAARAARTSGAVASAPRVRNGIPMPLGRKSPHRMKRRPLHSVFNDGGSRRPSGRGGFTPSSAF